MADLIYLMPEWSPALSELIAAMSTINTITMLEVVLLLPARGGGGQQAGGQ